MNDFERKLRETPLRQPPAQLRDEILGMPAAEPVAGNNQSARTSSETSPQRWFGEADESRARGKARPLLGVLLKPSSIFCIFIATVMTGATALFVGANSAGKSSWERYSDEARARGVKMSLKDLLPAPIPDAENFAAVPLFANLFSEDEAVRKMAGDALACGFPEQPKDARSTAMGAPRYSLSDWQTFFVKSGDISTATADPAADVLRALEHRFGPHLAELAEAERRPHAVFPVKWELGFMAGLPHLSVIQSAAKIHRIRLAAYLAQGNTAEALAELRGMLRLYRALEKEPTMISGLVRVSVLKLAVSEVWEGVVTAAWDAAALEKIEDDLAGFNLLADCQLAFASERAGINDALESALSGQLPFTGAEMGFGQDPGRQMLLRAIPKIPGWISLNQIAMNRFHDQAAARIDAAAGRFYDTGEIDAQLQEIDRSIVKQHIYVLYRVMAPVVAHAERNFLYTHTALHLATLACALERRRLAEGAYSETLAGLVPRYLSALPHDVMNGEPLHYRRTADGKFLLYSVALNGIDDGGAIGEKEGVTAQLDWAWRWPDATDQPRK